MKNNINRILQNAIQRQQILFNCSQSESVNMMLRWLNDMKLDYKKKGIDDLLFKIIDDFENELNNNYENK